jgi:hypothetical protein
MTELNFNVIFKTTFAQHYILLEIDEGNFDKELF